MSKPLNVCARCLRTLGDLCKRDGYARIRLSCAVKATPEAKPEGPASS